MRRWFRGAITIAHVAILVGACGGGTSSSDNSATGDGGSGANDGGDSDAGSVNGGSGGDAGPPACDAAKAPLDAPGCVVADPQGAFVDGKSGSDTNDGSQATPWKTIAHALTNAGTKKHVYVCAGTYAENVAIAGDQKGLAVYGGLSCGAWIADAANTVNIAPATGFALKLDGAQNLTLGDMTFTAAAGASATAPNSIAGLVSAHGATFMRLAFVADAGFSQSTAAAPATNHGTIKTGDSATSMSPGGETTCSCVDAASTSGGQGCFPVTPGTYNVGLPGLPSEGAGTAGSTTAACAAGGDGVSGSHAPAAAAGIADTKLGAFDMTTGWAGGKGTGGANGVIAQGGGGGGCLNNSNGYGGAGGCGGCGGHGGGGGLGGGSSIALMVVGTSSEVTITSCTFKTGAGGAGGAGASGEVGQAGGNGGPGDKNGMTPLGCVGGSGGDGSGGNGGNGGPGGSSIGLLFYDAAPMIDGGAAKTTASAKGFTIGAAGTPGPAGGAGAAVIPGISNPGHAGFAGPSGVAAAIKAGAELP
jgi:hypothetical protein